MQGPFTKLTLALRTSRTSRGGEQSKYVGIYEMLVFLLVVPSILIFQVWFIFVVSNFWIASQIGKNRFTLSACSIVFINVFALPISHILGSEYESQPIWILMVALVISLTLTTLGSIALVAQKRIVRGG